MDEKHWIKVVIHPLGFTGYALALVFSALAKYGPTERWPWLMPVAIGLAGLSVIGGLSLAHNQLKKPASPPAPSLAPSRVDQKSKGSHSPNIISFNGGVSYTVNDSESKKPHKSPKNNKP